MHMKCSGLSPWSGGTGSHHIAILQMSKLFEQRQHTSAVRLLSAVLLVGYNASIRNKLVQGLYITVVIL